MTNVNRQFREDKKVSKIKIKTVLIAVLAVLFFYGCGDNASENLEPVIFEFSADSSIIEPGAQSIISIKAGDPEEDALFFSWSVTDGSFSETKSGGIWTAPDVEGKYQISVEVSDGENRVSQTIEVWVWKPREGDYYPLAVGNKWLYVDEKGNEIKFEIIDKITIEGKDVESYVLEKTNSAEGLENVVSYSYIGKRSDGIDQYGSNVAPGSSDTLVFEPSLPLYSFPLIPGKSWRVEFTGRLPEGYFIGQGTAEYEVISEEKSMTVPAGTFHNVFRVRETFAWNLIGQSLDQTVADKWLAPDVGIIKFTQEQTRGGQTVKVTPELVEYNTVSQ